jgi:trehalose 6-phosphate phosphatase
MRHLLSHFQELERLASERSHVLLALDFDGTLCPIVEDPASAAVSPEMLQVLRRLCVNPQVTLAIVSGRQLSEISASLPLDAVYAGNHGLEIFGKGLTFRHAEAEAAQELLSEICWTFQATLDAWPGAWLEQKLLTATVHFRQVPEEDHDVIALAVRSHMQRFDALFGVRRGRKAIEIFPRVRWDKGSALRYIRQEFGLEQSLCISIGDDETDETMFAAFPEDISVRVNADGQSRARFYLRDCVEVLTLLERLENSISKPQFAAAGNERSRRHAAMERG